MSRPYFLLGSVPLYLVGVGFAADSVEDLAPLVGVLGLALVWTVQLQTHFYNEFYDVETDRASGPALLTGGSQALVGSDVPPDAARWLGRGSVLLAVLSTGVLLAAGVGPLLVPIVGLALLGGWAYSSPPIRLVARGLGEVTVVALTAVLVPVTGFYLQAGTLGSALLGPILALVPLAFGLTLSTAVPDIEADRSTGKRTLAVRLGAATTAPLAAIAVLLGMGIGTWTIESLYPGAGLLGALGTGLTAVLAWPFFEPTRRGDRPAAGRFALVVTLAFGAVAFVLAGVGFLAG